MLFRLKRRSFRTAAVLMLASAGAALAQPAATAASEPASQPAPGSSGQVAEGERALEQMKQDREAVQKQLGKARQERDVVKVLCLTDKLSQLDVAIGSAGERMDNLRAAAQNLDTAQMQHELSMIAAMRDRVSVLVSEADQCLGEELAFVAEPQVTMEVDPDIPEDATRIPEDEFVSLPPVVNSATY